MASYAVWSSIGIIFFLGGISSLSQLPLLLELLAFIGFTSSSGTGYLVYLLVNRRNTHSAREEAMFWKTLQLAGSSVPKDDLKTQLALGSVEHDLAVLSQGKGEKSAVLWGLLVVIPYFGWVALLYILGFLTDDLNQHDRDGEAVVQGLERLTRDSEGEGVTRRTARPLSRNVLGLLAASIITLGVFSIFWLYLAMEDPIPHFQYHSVFEEGLVKPILAKGLHDGGES